MPSINHAGGFWSDVLNCELRLDLVIKYKTVNHFLHFNAHEFESFDCYEITDMTNSKDLTHLKLDKEIWPCLKSEIESYIDRESTYLTSSLDDRGDEDFERQNDR